MSSLTTVLVALAVALIGSAGVVLAALVQRRPSRRQRQQDAWTQATSELRNAYLGEINHLRGQCDAKDKEIRRLNRVINRGGANDE